MLAAVVLVSVFGLFRPERLVVKPAQGTVVLVQAGTRSFTLEGAQSAGFRFAGGGVDCFARRELSSAAGARISARGGGAAVFLLSVPGKIERRFEGVLEIRPAARALAAVLEMDLEQAVAAAVLAESPPGAPVEMVRAQAVLVRSYYASAGKRHAEADFCDTTHCQFLRAAPAPGSAPRQAAEATRGLVLSYRGAPFAPLYSAECGGRTQTPAAIHMPEGVYPYFAVDCPCRIRAAAWTSRLPGEFTARLMAGPDETLRLEIGRRLGWKALPGNNFTARVEGGALVVSGRGAGHGVGLCQQGAAAMAGGGAAFDAILRHYFPDTELAGR